MSSGGSAPGQDARLPPLRHLQEGGRTARLLLAGLWLLSKKRARESVEMPARGSLHPASCLPGEVQATTRLAHFSESQSPGCRIRGRPPTHSKVRTCLFCERAPRRRRARVPPAPAAAPAEGALLSARPSAGQGGRPQTRPALWHLARRRQGLPAPERRDLWLRSDRPGPARPGRKPQHLSFLV